MNNAEVKRLLETYGSLEFNDSTSRVWATSNIIIQVF